MHWTSTDPSSGLAVVLGANTYITSGLTTTGDCCRNPNPKIKNLIGIFWYSANFDFKERFGRFKVPLWWKNLSETAFFTFLLIKVQGLVF